MRILGLILLFIALLALWDVAWWKLGDVTPMSPWRLQTYVDEGSNVTILDVRTPAEYRAFHIKGAVNLPFPVENIDLTRLVPNQDQAIVVVCMTGHRSPPVVRQLQQDGYTNVVNLTGGMAAWKIFGGKTISGR